MAGEPNDVSYKNNKYIQCISKHYPPKSPKDVAVGPNGCVSIVHVKEGLLFNVISLMPVPHRS